MTEKELKQIFNAVKPIKYVAIKGYQNGESHKLKTNGDSVPYNTITGNFDSIEAAALAATTKEGAEIYKMDFEAVFIEAIYEEVDGKGEKLNTESEEELRIVNE